MTMEAKRPMGVNDWVEQVPVTSISNVCKGFAALPYTVGVEPRGETEKKKLPSSLTSQAKR